MSISSLTRVASGSLLRGLWNRDRAAARRRGRREGFAPAIDRLESRRALAITTPLSIGGATVGSFTDTPTGPGAIGDFVTVSIEGTRGTVIFNGGKGVADGTDIQTVEIVDASPDFQLTFNGTIRTANPVPYGSDGIVQLGTITTNSVIRGINTVRGEATKVAVAYTPYGFTQTGGNVGTATLSLAGDLTGTFAGGSPGTFVVATPLLPAAGTPVFTTVNSSSYDAGTDTTAITLTKATGTGTTAGALTTAEVRNVEFQLTKFTGVNFSNRGQKYSGGIFVDTVLGDGAPAGDRLPADAGIVLSQGLLAYSTIGIRKELQAAVVLGTSRDASVDGRMFVEGATADSGIYVGPNAFPVARNSTFELVGGAGPFGADVFVSQPFQGVINLQTAATGTFAFAGNVGGRAVLESRRWDDVRVEGNFAGTITTAFTNRDVGNIVLFVGKNVAATARVNGARELSLRVDGGVAKGAKLAVYNDVSLGIGGNFAGSLSTYYNLRGSIGGSLNGATLMASDDLTLAIGGSIVKSSIAADDSASLDVAGGVRGSQLSAADGITLDVQGNVSGSSVQAGNDVVVDVAGSVTTSQFTSTPSDVTLNVGGDLLKSRILATDFASVTVGRDALDNTVLTTFKDASLDIGRHWRGVAQSAGSDLLLDVGGSVFGGSTFMSGGDTRIDVVGDFDATTTSRDLRFFVDGNVSAASRIVAQRVSDWQSAGTPNFGIGGRLDGVVNVGVFDAAPNVAVVTILGSGAGTTARFNVGRFETDTLVFNGDFRGNLRTLQDLVANLQFNGNVDRITIGGRVGGYDTAGSPVPVTIDVAGRLLYLDSNSYFEATTPGRTGTFWNDSTKASSTGTLTTGRYVTVVSTLQTQPAPPTPDPMQYDVPGTPTNFSAAPTTGPDGITVSFSAPTSNGNLPVIYYEYTTNNGANWRRFMNPAQGPGSTIALPGPSTGGSTWSTSPSSYDVAVRAVNALGAGIATSSTNVVIPSPP